MPRHSALPDEVDPFDRLLDRLADKIAIRLRLDNKDQEARPPRRAFRMSEVGELISVSEREVYVLIKQGELHAIRVGRLVLVPSSAIDEFLKRKLAEAGDN
jgi:excisionase family DNA binding protein